MNTFVDYPHPILSTERDDYNKNCSFNVSFHEEDIIVDHTDIIIPVNCELQSIGLSSLISQGKAAIVVLIISSAAFYRKTFEFNSAELTKVIKIPKFHVRKNINFCGYILAKENIRDFHCKEEFNNLYFKDMSFDIKKADILAQGQTQIIPIDDSELEKPISSIFRIKKDIEQDSMISIDFEHSSEKIIISLNEHLNQLYYEIKDFNNGTLHRYLNGLIIYPVLVEALSKICDFYRRKERGYDDDYDDDYNEKRWFRVIEHKVKDLGFDLSKDFEESNVPLADQLLGNISHDGLLEIKNIIEEEINSGEYTNTGGID